MMQCLLLIVFVLLALFGITELIHRFLSFLMKPKDYKDYLIVLLYDVFASDYLKTAVYKFNLDGGRTFKKIIAVDCGIDLDNLPFVIKMVQSNTNIIFTSTDNLDLTIQKLKENNIG